MKARHLVVIVLAAVALLTLTPSVVLAVDTRIDRHDEHIGLLHELGPGRWFVQNLDYRNVADVRRDGSQRYVFTHKGRRLGSVVRATATVWRVHVAGRSEPIGTVRKAGKHTWTAEVTRIGDPCGAGTGSAPIPAAAAVIIVWGG